MYESLQIDDFCHVLYIIRDNHKKHDSLTHKQVRVYLNCMRQLWASEDMYVPDSYYLPLIKFHFYAMSCRLSHEKRAILASQLLDLLKQLNITKVEVDKQSKQEQVTTADECDPDDIPFNPGDVSLLLETSPGNF
jgi:CRISPR/Cas system-associated exonuclease Cas4 (RecB family)